MRFTRSLSLVARASQTEDAGREQALPPRRGQGAVILQHGGAELVIVRVVALEEDDGRRERNRTSPSAAKTAEPLMKERRGIMTQRLSQKNDGMHARELERL